MAPATPTPIVTPSYATALFTAVFVAATLVVRIFLPAPC